MKASISLSNETIAVDLSQPIDISLPLHAGPNNVHAWYVPDATIEPVTAEGFIGEVKQGGSVNFKNIFFNPHGHGTHTECVGHITTEFHSVQDALIEFHFKAQLCSIEPTKKADDRVITKDQIVATFTPESGCKAFIVRTLPNSDEKLTKQYSNDNAPYLEPMAMRYLIDQGIEHFIIDTPSVDPEFDDGLLLAHRAYWEHPEDTNTKRTITEMAYISNEVADGMYLLNLQMASFVNDASPSKPVLYKIL